MIECSFDGSLCPHKQLIGGGWIITENGTTIRVGCASEKKLHLTSNYAEYFALFKLLESLKKERLNKKTIVISGDNKIVINQMNKIYAVKEGSYRSLALKTHEFFKTHFNGNVTFKWVPRSGNVAADAASRLEFPKRKVSKSGRKSRQRRDLANTIDALIQEYGPF